MSRWPAARNSSGVIVGALLWSCGCGEAFAAGFVRVVAQIVGLDAKRVAARTVVAEPRRRQEVTKAVDEPDAGLRHIARDAPIFAERNCDRIESVDVLDQTELGRVAVEFRDKCAEQAIPDDQRACIVRVEITRIARV